MKKRTVLFLFTVLAVCLCLFTAHAETLKLGDTGENVLQLNTRLRQLNYTAVRAADTFTESTAVALTALQNAYGLPATGEADEATLDILYGECYRPLKMNDSGADVKLLQEKLIEMGYYWGNPSGNYLEGTTAAIQTFQGECSLPITGEADVKTQALLFSLSVRPTPTPTPVPTPAPERTPTPTPGPYQPFPGTLQRGSRGDTVPKVQQRLMDLGYFTFYKTTQNYMDQTVQAVKSFQAANGLEVTGIVDEETWNVLFNDTDVRGVGDEKKPEFQLPYFFEVDVNNQVVKVWKYNRDTQDYTDLDRAFICTTGSTAYPTALGTFTLTGRKSQMCWFPDWGGGHARWWVKIGRDKNGTFAFHSVLYSQWDDDSTLKVSSFTGLGKRGSHGCIRLTVADAKWIYDHVREGMQVWIRDDAPDDPELKAKVKPGELNSKTMMPNVTPEPPQYTYDGTQAPETAERALSEGKSGQDVYWLQMKLKELGYYTGTATGTYLGGTKKAVSAYQKANGLGSDGIAGVKTLNYLYQQVRDAYATPTPEPQAVPDLQTEAPEEENGVNI